MLRSRFWARLGFALGIGAMSFFAAGTSGYSAIVTPASKAPSTHILPPTSGTDVHPTPAGKGRTVSKPSGPVAAYTPATPPAPLQQRKPTKVRDKDIADATDADDREWADLVKSYGTNPERGGGH